MSADCLRKSMQLCVCFTDFAYVSVQILCRYTSFAYVCVRLFPTLCGFCVHIRFIFALVVQLLRTYMDFCAR